MLTIRFGYDYISRSLMMRIYHAETTRFEDIRMQLRPVFRLNPWWNHFPPNTRLGERSLLVQSTAFFLASYLASWLLATVVRSRRRCAHAKDKFLTAEKNIYHGLYTKKEEEGAKAQKNRGLFKNYPPRSVCAMMMMRSTDWMERIRLLSQGLSRKDCESPGGSTLNNDSFVAMELPLPTDAAITTTRQQRQHRHYYRRNCRRRRRHRYHHRLSCSHHHQRIMRRWPEGATTRERERRREVAARSSTTSQKHTDARWVGVPLTKS